MRNIYEVLDWKTTTITELKNKLTELNEEYADKTLSIFFDGDTKAICFETNPERWF